MALPTQAGSCSPNAIQAEAATETATKPARLPLYLIDRRSALWRIDMGLGTRTPVKLAELAHPQYTNSGDSAWIARSGFNPRDSATEVWLFERASGKERKVAALPGEYGTLFPRFSPNNRWLSFLPLEDTRGDEFGLYLVDIENGSTRFLGRPGLPGQWTKGSRMRQFWSRDSSQLLVRVDPPGDAPSLAFNVEPASGKMTQLAQASVGYGPSFRAPTAMIRGVDLPLAEEAHFPSQSLRDRAPSPDGKFIAMVDAEHQRTVLATGFYDDCMGMDSVSAIGWAEGHRFLLYSVDMDAYVFDTETGRRWLMANKYEVVNGFFW
jgi:hypothetical protein